MNVKEIEFTRIPIPNIKINNPVSIGFLTYLYGPSFISFGGGLKGTGVPFFLKKVKTHQSVRRKPKIIRGIEIIRFNG